MLGNARKGHGKNFEFIPHQVFKKRGLFVGSGVIEAVGRMNLA